MGKRGRMIRLFKEQRAYFLIFLFLFILFSAFMRTIKNKHFEQLLVLEKEYTQLDINQKYADDNKAKIAIEEAMIAAKEGNYGVGAVIYKKSTGEIVARGHNKVFHPHFRSDLHAEMDVLNKYEKSSKSKEVDKSNLVLITSLEPCPMCFTRILTSGIPTVKYIAADSSGGMVHLKEHMPPVFKKMAEGRDISQAHCSPEVQEMANEVFLLSRKKLDEKLIENK
jgi:tRNA(adenine34) deaminase